MEVYYHQEHLVRGHVVKMTEPNDALKNVLKLDPIFNEKLLKGSLFF